jgi:hypothetical protein
MVGELTRKIAIVTIAALSCGQAARGLAARQAARYDFGENINGNPVTHTVTTVSNSLAGPVAVKYSLSGDAAFSVNKPQSCGSSLAGHGSCAMDIMYRPSESGSHAAALTVEMPGANGELEVREIALSGVSETLPAGTVTTTNNPQVAQYSITPPYPANVVIEFGPTTSYGLNTWSQPADGADALVMLVAGMQLSSTYHMQATVTLANGVTVTDVDHTFTTTKYPNSLTMPTISVTTASGASPSPGIEMMDNTYGAGIQAYATDLSGNVIWGYDYGTASSGTIPQPVRLLPNGHILVTLSYASQDAVLGGKPGATVITEEIDLAGNVVRSITLDQLNTALVTAGYTGATLTDIHHDAIVLPNGHWVLLANSVVPSSELPGYTGSPANVIGDMVVDLDETLTPVWWWNEFDFLNINRLGWSWPDWTHTNTVLYSPTDGNLVISIRHQDWVLKVNYANGTGDGSVLWYLGDGGSFTLMNGTAPTDWQSGQHKPSFTTANTAGMFNMVMMDNGNFRQFPSGVKCGTTGNPPCYYSTVPEFQINESAMTATLVFHDSMGYGEYSSWGGNAEALSNGNMEADFCASGNGADVYEIVPQTQQQIWHLHVTGQNLYRAERIGSMYPGVTWGANAPD